MITTVNPQTELQQDAYVVLEFAKQNLADDSAVLELLQNIATMLGRGEGVVTTGTETQLSPNEAAKVLGMSRPHLVAFMDAGALPFSRVGTHRRIKMADLVDFDQRRDGARKLVTEARMNASTAEAELINRQAPLTDEVLADLDSF